MRARTQVRAILRRMRKRCDKLGLNPADVSLAALLHDLLVNRIEPKTDEELDKILVAQFPKAAP